MVLEPHFRCERIEYHQYRRFGTLFGLLKVAIEPLVFLPLFTILIALKIWGVAVTGWWWFGLLLVSQVGTFARRRSAFHSVLNQVDARKAVCSPQQSSHVIAHSFGSYLTARMTDLPTGRFGAIVFAGCILRCFRRWQQILRDNPHSVERVQNEVQLRDFLVLLAPLLCLCSLRFGAAGILGFRRRKRLVHTVPSPNRMCPTCTITSRVPIHNVWIREFGHSDVFLTPSYAAYFWLPFFFEIEPCEYSRFVKSCWECAQEVENRRQSGTLNDALGGNEISLRDHRWRWLKGSLAKGLHLAINDDPQRGRRDSDLLVDRALRQLWQCFMEAQIAYSERRPDHQEVLLSLNPVTAFERAVNSVLSSSNGS